MEIVLDLSSANFPDADPRRAECGSSGVHGGFAKRSADGLIVSGISNWSAAISCEGTGSTTGSLTSIPSLLFSFASCWPWSRVARTPFHFCNEVFSPDMSSLHLPGERRSPSSQRLLVSILLFSVHVTDVPWLRSRDEHTQRPTLCSVDRWNGGIPSFERRTSVRNQPTYLDERDPVGRQPNKYAGFFVVQIFIAFRL